MPQAPQLTAGRHVAADPLLGSEIGVPRILGFRWPDFDEAELHLVWVTMF